MKDKTAFLLPAVLIILKFLCINQVKGADTADIFMADSNEGIAVEEAAAASPLGKTKGINRSNAEILRIYSGRFPKFREAVIAPLDIKVGEIQKLTLSIEDPDGVSSVSAEIEHDHGRDKVSLRLSDGSREKGTWSGEWKAHDTHSKTYHTTFTAVNRKGKSNSITLAWSDPCSPPASGDWTLDGNCTVSGALSINNGNFIVAGPYTLTIASGGTFSINDGKQIIISGGSIAMSGGQMTKVTPPACSADGTACSSDTACCSGICGTDADNDGYFSQALGHTGTCQAAAKPYTDCCDSSAWTYPGADYSILGPDACGSFDLNCDGQITKRPTEQASSCYTQGTSECTGKPQQCCSNAGSTITGECGWISCNVCWAEYADLPEEGCGSTGSASLLQGNRCNWNRSGHASCDLRSWICAQWCK